MLGGVGEIAVVFAQGLEVTGDGIASISHFRTQETLCGPFTTQGVSGRLKPATKERFKTSHSETGVRPVPSAGNPIRRLNGEREASGCKEHNTRALQSGEIAAADRPGLGH